MTAAAIRLQLRRGLEEHLDGLGYTFDRRIARVGGPEAEIARVSPVRGRLVYGETILAADLRSPRCHERLRFFSQRRTRRRSQILFFIAVEEEHRTALEELLVELGIRSTVRGAHVHIIPIARTSPKTPTPKAPKTVKAAKTAKAAPKPKARKPVARKAVARSRPQASSQ